MLGKADFEPEYVSGSELVLRRELLRVPLRGYLTNIICLLFTDTGKYRRADLK